jgi:hypothetical protein
MDPITACACSLLLVNKQKRRQFTKATQGRRREDTYTIIVACFCLLCICVYLFLFESKPSFFNSCTLDKMEKLKTLMYDNKCQTAWLDFIAGAERVNVLTKGSHIGLSILGTALSFLPSHPHLTFTFFHQRKCIPPQQTEITDRLTHALLP